MELFKAVSEVIRLVLVLWLLVRVIKHWYFTDPNAQIEPSWLRGTLILIVLTLR